MDTFVKLSAVRDILAKGETKEKADVRETLRRLYGQHKSIRVGKDVYHKHWLVSLRKFPADTIKTTKKVFK